MTNHSATNCGTCRFSDVRPRLGHPSANVMLCRRHAPSTEPVAWPCVWPDDWCGEAEPAPTPQWQPMETAPRDGRWVLLRTPLGSLEVARFLGPGEKPWITKNGPHYGDYDRFLAGWFPIPGEEGPQ